MANSENVKKWISALRSGQYVQGEGRLKKVESGRTLHCCLGVACEVAMQNGVQLTVEEVDSYSVGTTVTLFDNESAYLPLKVQKWLGLTSENPRVWVIEEDGLEGYQELVDLNDSGESDFEQIANLIEAQWVNEGAEDA